MAPTKTRSKFWCFSRRITQKLQNYEVSVVKTRFSPHFQVGPTSGSKTVYRYEINQKLWDRTLRIHVNSTIFFRPFWPFFGTILHNHPYTKNKCNLANNRLIQLAFSNLTVDSAVRGDIQHTKPIPEPWIRNLFHYLFNDIDNAPGRLARDATHCSFHYFGVQRASECDEQLQ